jgi:hypothetical protein
MESFHVGGLKVGALIRKRSATELVTLNCFLPTNEPLVDLRHRFSHDGDPFQWTGFSYDEANGCHVAVRRDGCELVDADGRRLGSIPERCVPSYASYLLLQRIIRGECGSVGFSRLGEGCPDLPIEPARLTATGQQTVTLPDGTTRDCRTAALLVDRQVTDRFWFDDHELIASNWRGAMSFRATQLDELLDGLDPLVVDVVRDLCT